MPLSSTIIVLAIPFFMFLFLGLVGVKMPRKITGVIGVLAMAVTTVWAYAIAFTYFFGTDQGQVVDGVRQQLVTTDWTWLSFYANKMIVRLGVLLDPISAMMLVVITTVSFMVHLYSLGYMSDHEGNPEKGFQRYYADLALFTFSMLGLVVSTNIFQMFVFFEMVGVSSYLLIGFYYGQQPANHASKKAFIVTRLADLFFLIGIMVLSYYTETFDFKDLMGANGQSVMSMFKNSQAITFMGCSVTGWALTFIFIGGAGKSAMYPLHIWLPDAMEGPTPVSALIHAATMVVAGVFLVARLFPLYIVEQGAMDIICVVGAFTAFSAEALAARFALLMGDYAKVETYTDDIVTNGGFSLYPDYYDLFKIPGKLCDESLMEVQVTDFGLTTGDYIGIDQWYVSQGASLKGTVGSEQIDIAGWNFCQYNTRFVDWCKARGETTRLEVSCLQTGDKTRDNFTVTSSGIFNGKAMLPYDQMTGGNTEWGRNNNVRLMRYAEVLLMNAEAKVRNGKSGDAPFNEVRTRANMPTVNGVTLEDILDERRIELCSEWGLRYTDLVRTGKAETVLNDPALVRDQANGEWTTAKAWWPVPGDQLTNLPDLALDPE